MAERDHKMSRTSVYESELEESILSNTSSSSVLGKSKAIPTEEEVRSSLDAQLNISTKGIKSVHDGATPNTFVPSQQQPKNSNIRQMEIPRQISVDISAHADVVANKSNFAAGGAGAGTRLSVSAPHERLAHSSKRHSESSDYTPGGNLLHKDQWGWFEDVHEGETDGDDKDEGVDNTVHSIIADLMQSPHGILEKNGKKGEHYRF